MWFVYTANAPGMLSIDTCTDTTCKYICILMYLTSLHVVEKPMFVGSLLHFPVDTVLEVYSGACGSLTLVGCNDDSCITRSLVSVSNVTTGVSYYIRVGSWQSRSTGTFKLQASMYPCGANPVTGNSNDSLAIGGVYCDTPPTSIARVFTANQISNHYTINCVSFGTSGEMETSGTLSIYIDPTGGDPSFFELRPVASKSLLIPKGIKLLTVSFYPFCVQLTGDETLVVVIDFLGSRSTFRGGSSAVSPTYFKASACGIDDFVSLASFGFPGREWFVMLYGDFGCSVTPTTGSPIVAPTVTPPIIP